MWRELVPDHRASNKKCIFGCGWSFLFVYECFLLYLVSFSLAVSDNGCGHFSLRLIIVVSVRRSMLSVLG